MPKIGPFKKWKNNEVLTSSDYVFERDSIVDKVNLEHDRSRFVEEEVGRVEDKFDGEVERIDSTIGADSERIDDLETEIVTKLNRNGSNADPNIKIVDTTFKATYDDRNAIQDLDFKAAPAKGATATSSSFNQNVGLQEYHNKVRDYTKDHIDDKNNPHQVTAAQLGVPTNAQLTTALNLKVDKTTTVAGVSLQNNITTQQIKDAIGNATQSISGLLSVEDKVHLDTLVEFLGSVEGDENQFVDTLREVLDIFAQYPEELNLVEALNAKVDKVQGKALSENDFTNALKEKLDNIEAEAQVNVQSDFNQTDTEADDFIKNKPTLETLGGEPAFEKNTAFNKDFGNEEGTVTEGNDPRLSDARTPLTHTHEISEVNNLQTALNGKINLNGDNSNLLNLKFQNQNTEDALAVGELRLNKNLPEWQISGNTLHLVGRQLIERAINRTGAQLTTGKPLFISGVFTPGGGPGTDRIEVNLATRSNANGVFAVASCPASNNTEGCIVARGTVKGWNTSGFTAGAKLYLTDQAGEYNVGPVGDGGQEFFVGTVIRAANDGIVYLNPTRITDALFVAKSQLGVDVPILDEEGLILPQFLGDRYSDVFKGYGVFDVTDPEFPILLDFYLVDQWDLVNNEPIDPAVKAPYRSGTIYVTLNVTIDTMYRYDETSQSFVGLAPSPVGLGTTPGTAYPGNLGQDNRDDIDTILGDYATQTNLTAHVTDTNNPHAVTKTQVGLGNVDNTSDADKPISTATQTALNLKADQSSLQAHIDDTTNPHQTTATQVGLGNVLDYGVASEEEAKAGTVNDKYMTPLRVNQAIQELAPDPDFTNIDSHIADSTIHFTQANISITESQISDLGNYEPANANIQTHISSTNNPHSVTKTQVGLGNVDNVQQIPLNQKGAANGVASLDANTKVPLAQLPDAAKQQTYVVATFANLPTTNILSGDKGYVTGTGDSYIWNGSTWLVLAEADWENVNLDYSNIINPPTIGNGTLTLGTSGIATGSQTFSANQTTNGTFTVNVPATNIAQGTRTTTTVPVTSSTGTNATLQAATTTLAGVMTSADKTKLNGIETGAQVNTVTSVAGKTGAVTLVKGDVGLGNVDNVKQAVVEYYTTTIATTNWSGSEPATAVKTVSGLLNTDKPLIDVDLSAVTFANVEAKQTEYAKIFRVAATAANQITFYATETPTEELVIQIKVVR